MTIIGRGQVTLLRQLRQISTSITTCIFITAVDNVLAVLKNQSGPQSEQVKKNIQKIFKEHGLDIILQCNMKIVSYLDVTFNLNDGTYKPYTKPNNEIKYLQEDSNHPLSVIR